MKTFTAEEQAMFTKGLEAEAFLTNPAFASAINEMSENIANAILASKIEETEKRERLYNLYLALSELIAMLSARVAIKENLAAAAQDDDSEIE